jgi:hypothetical protein
MDNLLWLERLREALARRRLPAAYADRLAQELSDHFHDLTEEKMSTEALLERLGEPEQVAHAARAEYRGGFFQRHRWLGVTTFVVLPLPLLVVGWALVWVALWLVGMAVAAVVGESTLDQWTRDHAPALAQEQLLIQSVMSASVVVPAVILGGLYHWLARRTRTGRGWALAAGVLLACCAGSATTAATFSDEPGKSTMMFGFGFGKYNRWQLGQFLMPLAVAGLCARAQKSEPEIAV